jgi:predicted RNase H-like HicB family nuclease
MRKRKSFRDRSDGAGSVREAGPEAAAVRGTARRRTYTVVFEPQPEGGYTVLVPALPGCLTEGDTLAEARRNAGEAILVYCESLLMDGMALPQDIRRPLLHEKVVVTVGGP